MESHNAPLLHEESVNNNDSVLTSVHSDHDDSESVSGRDTNLHYLLAESEPQPMCRICHGDDTDGKLITGACGCTGSLAYAHVECLTKWANQRQRDSDPAGNNGFRLTAAAVTCELCGEEYNIPVKFVGLPGETCACVLAYIGVLLCPAAVVNVVLFSGEASPRILRYVRFSLATFIIWLVMFGMAVGWIGASLVFGEAGNDGKPPGPPGPAGPQLRSTQM